MSKQIIKADFPTVNDILVNLKNRNLRGNVTTLVTVRKTSTSVDTNLHVETVIASRHCLWLLFKFPYLT